MDPDATATALRRSIVRLASEPVDHAGHGQLVLVKVPVLSQITSTGPALTAFRLHHFRPGGCPQRRVSGRPGTLATMMPP
jgi:hypothetical protein